MAADIGVPLVEIVTHEGDNAAYRANGPDRCFYCKDELFTRISDEVAARYGLTAVAYGENADDAARPDRPGSRAAGNHRVLRPLADAGLTKADVRAVARALGLASADKPAAPCLASRIPHFQEVTPEKLRQVEAAESALRALGFPELRVRHHGEVARIELPVDDLVRAVAEDVRRADPAGHPGRGLPVRRARPSRHPDRARSHFRWSSLMAEPDWQPPAVLTDLSGIADLDHDRGARRGYPEAIYCEAKTAGQVRSLAAAVRERGTPTLFTRAGPAHVEAVLSELPDARHDELARLLMWPPSPPEPTGGLVVVAAAGTSDLPVAREALLVATHLGRRTELVIDVGVAGLHRVLGRLDLLRRADVIVVVAGMDGALPSVVGGLVRVPVIAVPTSVGYGAAFEGLAALLSMLNSCAPGVAVVNIDNGYGAGHLAAQIAAPQ